jgi:hypothetical protein
MQLMKTLPIIRLLAGLALVWASPLLAADLDFSKYDPSVGIEVRRDGQRLRATWPAENGASCAVTFSLEPHAPLLESLEIGGQVLAKSIQPVYLLTTGARLQKPGVKYIFFDKPITGKNGPVRHFTSALELNQVRVASSSNRTEIVFNGLSAGPFSGELIFHLYAGSPFIHLEAALSQAEKGVAYIYDAVLDGDFSTVVWKDLQDRFVGSSGKCVPTLVKAEEFEDEKVLIPIAIHLAI